MVAARPLSQRHSSRGVGGIASHRLSAGTPTMPMIEIVASEGTFPPSNVATLLERATACLLKWEKMPGIPSAATDKAAFLNLLPGGRVTEGGKPAGIVRIQLLTPPHSLNQEQRAGIAADLADIVVELASDSSVRERTWVFFLETDGGRGIASTARANASLAQGRPHEPWSLTSIRESALAMKGWR